MKKLLLGVALVLGSATVAQADDSLLGHICDVKVQAFLDGVWANKQGYTLKDFDAQLINKNADNAVALGIAVANGNAGFNSNVGDMTPDQVGKTVYAACLKG